MLVNRPEIQLHDKGTLKRPTISRRSQLKRVAATVLIGSSIIMVAGCSDDDDDDAQPTSLLPEVMPSPIDMNGTGNPGNDAEDGMGTDNDDNDEVAGNGNDNDGDSISDEDDGDDDADQETVNADGLSVFQVPLSAEQTVPPLDLANAEAEGSITIDRNSGAIFGSVESEGLTGPAQAAHIHRAFAGQSGPIILTLDLDSDGDGDEFTVPDGAGLDSDALIALANGELYIDVHTVANSMGEVRGQIVPLGVLFEDSELSGEEMVPPTDSEGAGVGFSTVNEADGSISATIFLSDLSGVVDVSIHQGPAGSNGDFIMSMVRDETDSSTWMTLQGAMLTDEQLEAYEEEELYFLVTTAAFPDGEVRGQL